MEELICHISAFQLFKTKKYEFMPVFYIDLNVNHNLHSYHSRRWGTSNNETLMWFHLERVYSSIFMTLVHVKLLSMHNNTHSFAHLSSNKQVCADTYEQHGGHLNKAYGQNHVERVPWGRCFSLNIMSSALLSMGSQYRFYIINLKRWYAQFQKIGSKVWRR